MRTSSHCECGWGCHGWWRDAGRARGCRGLVRGQQGCHGVAGMSQGAGVSQGGGSTSHCVSPRLRLARMAEEMREAEAPPGQPGPLAGSSPTELQYRRCIQEFISLHLEES